MDSAALVSYLAEMEKNNNKTWFEANRARHDALRADFTDVVDEIIFGTYTFDQRIQGRQAKDCLYHLYRYVRFSRPDPL